MDLSPIPTEPGVYLMYDLNEKPTYAGQSTDLRSRLRQHFVRQDSSVTSYGRLDLRDIASVAWWTTDQTDRAEQDLLKKSQPYLNFSAEINPQWHQDEIEVEEPDGTFAVILDEEKEFRRRPYNRAKQKIEHINRMLDKIKYADHSDDTRRILYEHKRIFEENLQEFLDIDNLPE